MTPSQYAVTVTPRSAGESVWTEQQCVYSVSIGAANKTEADILKGLEWTRSHFDRIAVLIGDSLYAVTLQVQRGLDDSAAQAEALRIADQMIHVLEQRCAPVEIIRTSEVAALRPFLDIEDQLEAAYRFEPAFASSIDSDATSFVARQEKNKRLALEVDSARTLARKYLLREIATYAYLASIGWRVDVYLGRELPTLARIIEGTVPPVLPQLAQRVNISLLPKDKV